MDSFEVFNALIDGIFDEMKTVRMVHNRHWIFFSMKKKDKKKGYITSNIIKSTVLKFQESKNTQSTGKNNDFLISLIIFYTNLKKKMLSKFCTNKK